MREGYTLEEFEDLKVRALRDIWAFCDLINFKEGSENFYELHREMAFINTATQRCSHLEKPTRSQRRRIFLVPREHFKSTVNTVLYGLWRIYRNPNIRIVVMCHALELAESMIREMKAYLEDPELIETVWNDRPHIDGNLIPRIATRGTSYKRGLVEDDEFDESKVMWTKTAIQVNRTLKDKQPTLETLSVGKKPTGKHCDVVVMDDIVEWENSKTPELARKVQRSANEIESVVTKKARWVDICEGFGEWVGAEVLINGTRYYSWDYYAKFVGNDDTEQQQRLAITRYSAMVLDVYVNGIDDSEGYICPEIFDADSEREIRDTDAITRREWFAQFRNKIVPETEDSYGKEDLKLIFPTSYRMTEIPAVVNFIDTSKPIASGYETFPIPLWMTVDLSISTSRRADERAITVGGWDELRRLHVVDGDAGLWTPDELYLNIHKYADKWGITLVHYETGVGYQESFDHAFRTYNELKKLRTLVPFGLPVNRSISKGKKIELMLQPLMASQSLYVSSIVWQRTPLSRELENFNPNAKVQKDNMLDCIYMLSQNNPMASRHVRDNKNYGRHTYLNTMYGGTR